MRNLVACVGEDYYIIHPTEYTQHYQNQFRLVAKFVFEIAANP
jgi:hypothetical protein